MPRQPRIEYPGAYYHVMCRGDRQEAIFEDDEDREMFLRTLSECCEKSGWRVFAWVLMSNHYHWVLHTPEANLVAGMKWFQNTYTRRLNTRHAKWGHVFGGRYKAIVVESSAGGYLETLMDYVHLNPARAGLVGREDVPGLLDYRWSSLAQGYGVIPRDRPPWLAVKEGLELFGYSDDTKGRRKFVGRLERRALENSDETTFPNTGLQNTLRRGWYWGSQEFREKLVKLTKQGANRNYQTSKLGKEKSAVEAEEWIARARTHFGISEKNADAPREVRLAAAWAIHHRTQQSQSWIAEKLRLSSAANVSQQVRRIDSPNPPPIVLGTIWEKWRNIVRSW